LEVGDLRFDPGSRRASRGETQIELTAREASILEYLMRHEGTVLSKVDILNNVWDYDFEGDVNIVEVYVAHLRNKIDRPFGRETLQTIRGAGYRLTDDD
jgi:DNA-binding response OmpR family regulator